MKTGLFKVVYIKIKVLNVLFLQDEILHKNIFVGNIFNYYIIMLVLDQLIFSVYMVGSRTFLNRLHVQAL